MPGTIILAHPAPLNGDASMHLYTNKQTKEPPGGTYGRIGQNTQTYALRTSLRLRLRHLLRLPKSLPERPNFGDAARPAAPGEGARCCGGTPPLPRPGLSARLVPSNVSPRKPSAAPATCSALTGGRALPARSAESRVERAPGSEWRPLPECRPLPAAPPAGLAVLVGTPLIKCPRCSRAVRCGCEGCRRGAHTAQ